MTIEIDEIGVAAAAYEDIIREAVREALRAPELVPERRTLSEAERVDVVQQLHELRALLYRLLAMITQP